MPAWLSQLLTGLSLLLALALGLRTVLISRHDAAVKRLSELRIILETLRTEFGKLSERVGLTEMKMGVFWRLVEENLSGMLKRPTHAEMDTLLDGLKAHTLTLEESKRLRWWLQRVYLDDEAAHAQQRLTAILVIAAVESLIHELERQARLLC
jgi:hypothetical protein